MDISAIFIQSLRVRRYECDFIGHVNNGVYIHYLEQATEDAFAYWNFQTALDLWEMNQLTVEYLMPALPSDDLEMKVWVKTITEDTVSMGYELQRLNGQADILKAEIIWRCSTPLELRAKGAALQPMDCLALRPFIPPKSREGKPFYWTHVVRQYELNSKGHVSVAAYFNWFHHTVLRAADLKGWTREKWMCADLFAVHRRHHTEFFVPAGYQDELEIWGHLVEFKRVRGVFVNEVYNRRTGVLHMRDYIESVIVDGHGHPRLPPMGFVEALAEGEGPIPASPFVSGAK